jgi:protein-tyrosine kinase
MPIDLSREIVSPPSRELNYGDWNHRDRGIGRYFRACRGYKVSIGIFFLVGIVGSLLYRYSFPQLYRGSVLVNVGRDVPIPAEESLIASADIASSEISLRTKLTLATSVSLAQSILSHNPQLLSLVASATTSRSVFGLDNSSSPSQEFENPIRAQASAAQIQSYLGLISSFLIPGTTLVRISAVASDPLAAVKIANTHGQGFVDFILEEQRHARETIQKLLTRKKNDLLEKYSIAVERKRTLLEDLEKIGNVPAAQWKVQADLEVAKQVEETYQKSLGKIEELIQRSSLMADSDLESIGIVDSATSEPSSITSSFAAIIASGGLLGLICGILFAFFREATNSSINSLRNSNLGFDLPLLASIPALSSETRNAIIRLSSLGVKSKNTIISSLNPLRMKDRFNRAPVLLAAQFSPEGEAIRAMAASLSHLTLKSGLKIILFTSPDSGEGKTSLAVDTAIAFAQMHLKTLLIDANLRSPAIHQFFGLEKDASGLFDFALGGQKITDLFVESSVENLTLLLSGSPAPLPTLILDNEIITSGICSIAPLYDAIIIDAPGLGAVADCLFLSEVAHAVVFVVRFNVTDHQKALAALDKLRQFDAPLIGTVVNGVTGLDIS